MSAQLQAALNIIRRKQLEKKIGLSRSAIYDRLNPKSPNFDPSFPRPIPLGARAVGFVESECDSWLAARIESRKSA
ncbi:MAG: AlpA family phage regulatory protein [Thiobacillaceae bacterium]|jgi:prophage regulatory protein|nr:AlpA family phage regulatory protein [Thiobacillaceae bacterium]